MDDRVALIWREKQRRFVASSLGVDMHLIRGFASKNLEYLCLYIDAIADGTRRAKTLNFVLKSSRSRVVTTVINFRLFLLDKFPFQQLSADDSRST